MKLDDIVSEVGFVKKNFQGTAFRMNDEVYNRIVHLIKELEENVEEPKATKTPRTRTR